MSAVPTFPPERPGESLVQANLRVAYVVPMFPCWSDTWIVREIRALVGSGVEVTILSLRHPSEPFAHADTQALAHRVVYAPGGWAAVRAVARCIARDPRASLGTLLEAAGELWRRPAALAKTVVGWWRTLGVAERIAGARPAVVHAHFASYPSTSAMILSRVLRVPFTFTCHAHDIFVDPHLLRQKLDRAARAVTISEFNRGYIARRLGHAAAARLSVIHCGVKLDEFEYRSGQRDAGTIVGVARLDEVKGFAVLVEACRILRDRGRAFRCEVIGEGAQRRALEAQIRKAGLEDRVFLPGAMPQDEVRSRLARAAAFVLPSVVAASGNRDGIPVALMEAMAVGTPVVSTTVSGIPELVRSGWSGLLAEPGDAAGLAAHIEALFDDPERGARLAANARATIEQQFDSDLEAEKLLAALHEAAARPAVPPAAVPAASVVMVLDSTFPPRAGGGSEGQVLTLGRELTSQGIRVVVVSPRPDRAAPAREQVEGIEVVRLSYPKVPKVGGLVVLVRLAAWLLLHGRRHRAIHAHIAGGMAAVSCVLGRIIRRPVVVKLAGGAELDGGVFAAGRRGPATALALWALRRAAFYQATSERLAGHLVARGFDGSRVRHVPNAVDLSRFQPARRDPRPSASPEADLVAVFVGRLVREKALDLCLQAWAGAFPADASVALVIVGTGELETALRETAARLGIGHQVRFMGHQRDVRPFLGAADFALLPSSSEGLSNALLEYMAAGLPVLGSRISGTEDLVVPGETGWLFDSGDAGALRDRLREIRSLPRETLGAMGRRAREVVERRAGAGAVAERLMELYGLRPAPGP